MGWVYVRDMATCERLRRPPYLSQGDTTHSDEGLLTAITIEASAVGFSAFSCPS